MGDGRPVGYAEERALQEMGSQWAHGLRMGYGIGREYAENQHARKTKDTSGEEEAAGLPARRDALESRSLITYGANRAKTNLRYARR